MELIAKAQNYAAGKANEAITNAIAQAYQDGYQDGYKDCKDEIPVDLRDGKTQFIDLGLPSGTLWSGDYKKEGEEIVFLPYQKASLFQIPTEEQWEELLKFCKFEYYGHGSNMGEYCCIGPNGNHITFMSQGYLEGERHWDRIVNTFWLKGDDVDLNQPAANMYFKNQKNIIKNKPTFVGLKLPIRLIRK